MRMISNITTCSPKVPVKQCQNRKPNYTFGAAENTSTAPKESEHLGFLNYFMADVFAILIGCGTVDYLFKRSHQNEARDFALKSIKVAHKEDFSQIQELTKNVIVGLNAHSDDKTLQDASTQLKESFKKSFKTDIVIDSQVAPKEKDAKALLENMRALEEHTVKLFVKHNNDDAYTTIGKPFLKSLGNAMKKLSP